MNEIEKRFAAVKEVMPDAVDFDALRRVQKANDADTPITLDQMDEIKKEQEYAGKILVRVPRSLHKQLIYESKQEGVSLNQFILYKLTK